MTQLIAAQARKARKPHRDDSADYIIEAMDAIRTGYLWGNNIGSKRAITFTELRAIAQLKANNWHIQPGQVYTKQWNKAHGTTFTFKTLPHILKFCLKYKLYGDD
jgi:hypothetical protein